MVSANLNNVESVKVAVAECYGVFGVTNYWDKDVLDKAKEEQQGMNIFEACRSQGVKHVVWSSLPYAQKLTGGVLRHVNHFDSKAIVAEEMEKLKGSMVCSYFMPGQFKCHGDILCRKLTCSLAMYMQSAKESMRAIDGNTCLVMPFPETNKFAWPFIHPRTDSGKYIVGLFEAGASANGVHVHGVSCWTTIEELLPTLSNACRRQVIFKSVSPAEYQASLPEIVAEDLTQTMLLVGGYSYYGPGEEQKQAASHRWMVKGSSPSDLRAVVQASAPWQFE